MTGREPLDSFTLSALLFSDIPVHCPNQTATAGTNLSLTCNVSCAMCLYDNYTWKQDGQSIMNKTTAVFETSADSRTFSCTITNTTANDSGLFTFWVQMTSGTAKQKFYVTISSFPLIFCLGFMQYICLQCTLFHFISFHSFDRSQAFFSSCC